MFPSFLRHSNHSISFFASSSIQALPFFFTSWTPLYLCVPFFAPQSGLCNDVKSPATVVTPSPPLVLCSLPPHLPTHHSVPPSRGHCLYIKWYYIRLLSPLPTFHVLSLPFHCPFFLYLLGDSIRQVIHSHRTLSSHIIIYFELQY